jgi:hypothetical protein
MVKRTRIMKAKIYIKDLLFIVFQQKLNQNLYKACMV